MAYRMGSHLEAELLEKYSMGQLSETELDLTEEHLLVCAPCRNQLEETEMFISVAKAALADAARKPMSRAVSNVPFRFGAWFGRPLMVAGLAALAIGTVAVWNGGRINGLPQEVTLATTRGVEGAHVAPGIVELRVNAAQLPSAASYRFQLVSATGEPVWMSNEIPAQSEIRTVVNRHVGAGHYWVRVYGKGELLREYGLAVE
jgi:anti-sigma factor RsiW